MPISKQKLKEESSAVFKEATPVGGGFAGFFSLQAGTVLASTAIFGVALITFFYNLSAPNDNFDQSVNIVQYLLVYSYVSFTFIGTGIVSTCAFMRNPKWLLIGAIFVTVTSAYWVLMSILSFIPSPALLKYLCIMDRCPPTHWIFEVPWRRAGTDAYQPHNLDDSTTHATSDNTTTTTNATTTGKTDGNQTTISDVTSPIDLNSGPTFPPNATAPLVADDCSAATINNEFLLKELHDLKPIEKMEKRPPSNFKDDADDIDTQLDNTLYSDLNLTERARAFWPGNSSTTIFVTSTTSEPTTTTVPTTSTTIATTTEATVSVRQDPETVATATSGQHKDVIKYPLSQQNVNNDQNSWFPKIPGEVPEERQMQRDKLWGVKRYMSSQEVIYTDDMYGGNLTMSILSFVIYTIFLIYGIVCMFYLQKTLKISQRERREREERANSASKTSLKAHSSRKSQHSGRSQ